ncbi:MAG: hypothetical protein ACHQ4H_06410 [Ktedonobacterales bacterium]
MDELINQVTQRAGISPDQAQSAVQTVLGFLKDKLPAPIASQVEGILSGQGGGNIAGQAQQMMGGAGGLGGMLGGQSGQGTQGS